MADPYDWSSPETPREQWSDADWLRDEALANFVTEDVERAFQIAARLDGFELMAKVNGPVSRALLRIAELHDGWPQDNDGAHATDILIKIGAILRGS